MIKASVIVCTYRREETLRLIITDILNQNYCDFELIVVDQTPQHELETDQLLASQPERLRVLRVAIPNLPNARNRGIEIAHGEAIVFIDDDIRIERDFISKLLSHFDDKGVAAIAPVIVDQRGSKVALAEYAHRYGRLRKRAKGLMWQASAIIGACFAVRKMAIQAVGGFDAKLGYLNRSATGEDYDFFRRLRVKKWGVFVDPALSVLHLGMTPGGCDVRTSDPSESLRSQMHALAYIAYKENRRWGRLGVWLGLLRPCLLRRDVLQAGPRVILLRIQELREAIAHVYAFLQQQTASVD